MIRAEKISNDSEKYKLVVEGTEREFYILVGGADLYFCLTDYESGSRVTISKSDKDAYDDFNNLLIRMKKVDDKRDPMFVKEKFMWTSDARIPEESNKLEIYHEGDNLVFSFWRNDILLYRDCNISFCTFGAVNQMIVNELAYFFNEQVSNKKEEKHK